MKNLRAGKETLPTDKADIVSPCEIIMASEREFSELSSNLTSALY